nr:hypothetical protein [uncultured Cohaesibacter sp.]
MRQDFRVIGQKLEFKLRNLVCNPESLSTLVSNVNKRQVIFTITSGRSGSDTLNQLFTAVSDTTSLHEPEPSFMTLLRPIQYDLDLASDFLRYRKLPAICDAGTSRYVETSHLYCKGYFEPTLKMGLKPSFIFLKRDPRLIASSIYRGKAIPGKTRIALKYYLSPDDNVFLELPDWQNYSDYQLCYWYTREIERRQQVYASVAAKLNLAAFSIDIMELNEIEHVLAMMAALGIPEGALDMDRLAELTGRVFNLKSRPRDIPKDFDFAAQERKVDQNVRERISEEDVLAAIGI